MESAGEAIKPTRLMMKMVGVAGLLMIAIGLIYYIIADRALVIIPFALGVAITSGLNVFKLHLLEKNVKKIIQMDDKDMGKNIVRIQYLLRFLLTGAVLVAIGLIDNYTTAPPFHNPDRLYLAAWATVFPNAPEALLNAPLISIWGALAGIFTLQFSVILIRSLKLETDGDNFIEYVDDEDEAKPDGDEEYEEPTHDNPNEADNND